MAKVIALGPHLFNPWIVEWKGVGANWWDAVDDDPWGDPRFGVPVSQRTKWLTPYDPAGGVPHDRHISLGFVRPVDQENGGWRYFAKPYAVFIRVLAACNRLQTNIGFKITIVDNPWYRNPGNYFVPTVPSRLGVTGFHLKDNPYNILSTGGIYIIDDVEETDTEVMWFNCLEFFTPKRMNQRAGMSIILTSDFTGAMAPDGTWKPGYEDTYLRVYGFFLEICIPDGPVKRGGDFIPLPDGRRPKPFSG